MTAIISESEAEQEETLTTSGRPLELKGTRQNLIFHVQKSLKQQVENRAHMFFPTENSFVEFSFFSYKNTSSDKANETR